MAKALIVDIAREVLRLGKNPWKQIHFDLSLLTDFQIFATLQTVSNFLQPSVTSYSTQDWTQPKSFLVDAHRIQNQIILISVVFTW